MIFDCHGYSAIGGRVRSDEPIWRIAGSTRIVTRS
jgi:hypothetical protein